MGIRPCPCDGIDCEEVCQNDRVKSEMIIHYDNVFIRQDFCIEATVGVTPPPNDVTIQQVIQNTIFQYAPGETFLPSDPIRLMTVIAQNLSANFVDVTIQRAGPLNSDLPAVPLARATVTPNSEVALSATDANQLVASASVPSRVRFFITVFLPLDPI